MSTLRVAPVKATRRHEPPEPAPARTQSVPPPGRDPGPVASRRSSPVATLAPREARLNPGPDRVVVTATVIGQSGDPRVSPGIWFRPPPAFGGTQIAAPLPAPTAHTTPKSSTCSRKYQKHRRKRFSTSPCTPSDDRIVGSQRTRGRHRSQRAGPIRVDCTISALGCPPGSWAEHHTLLDRGGDA